MSDDDKYIAIDHDRHVINDADRERALSALQKAPGAFEGLEISASQLVRELSSWLQYYKGLAEGRSEQEMVEKLRD